MKRQLNDIRDDAKPVIVKNYQSHKAKINKDYSSNISCLPGRFIHKVTETSKYNPNSQKHLTSDIFNTRDNYNSFNISNKQVSNKVYAQSFDEKRIVDDGRSKRPAQIRNVFASQLTIS